MNLRRKRRDVLGCLSAVAAAGFEDALWTAPALAAFGGRRSGMRRRLFDAGRGGICGRLADLAPQSDVLWR